MASNVEAPNPFSLIRAASITPAAQGTLQSLLSQSSGSLQSLLSQGSGDLAEFVWPEEDRPTIPHNDYRLDRQLPVIDLSGLETGNSEVREKIAKRIAAACAKWGFFQLINHGVPKKCLDDVQDQARRFFELPMEQKQRAITLETANTTNNYGYGLILQVTNMLEGPGLRDFSAVGPRSLTWASRLRSCLMARPLRNSGACTLLYLVFG